MEWPRYRRLPKHCTGPHGPNGIEQANIHLKRLAECDAKKRGIFRHGAVEFWSAVLAQVAPDFFQSEHPLRCAAAYVRNLHCQADSCPGNQIHRLNVHDGTATSTVNRESNTIYGLIGTD